MFHSSMADNNTTDTTEDRKRKQVPSLMGSNKDQGEVGTGNRTKEFLENEKGAEVVSSTKKRKNHIKTSTQRISVTTEVLLCPRRQKCLLLFLKGINLKERSASIARVHFLYLIIIAIFFFRVFRDKKHRRVAG